MCDDFVDCIYIDKCNILMGKIIYKCVGTMYLCSDVVDSVFVGICDLMVDLNSDGIYDDCMSEVLCLDSNGSLMILVIKFIGGSDVYYS